MAATRQPGHPWRSYTEAERAEAVGLSATVGIKRASAQLGIPRRTLSSWLHRPTPEVQAAISRTREDVAARLWEAVTTGTDAVLAGLRDPKARLGDKASALRIVVEAHALISGGATSRTESTVATVMVNGVERDWRSDFPGNLSITADTARLFYREDGTPMTNGEIWRAQDNLRDWLDEMARVENATEAIAALPDPTAELDKPAVLALISSIERRLGDG